MKKILLSIAALIACVACILVLAACDKKEEPQQEADIYFITYNGVKIELGKDAGGVIAALGEAKSVKSLGDCGGFGAQVKYTYDDFELFTLKNDEGETIDGISFLNDIASTSKAICLGDSSDKVIEAYGEPSQKSDTELRYTKDNFVLKFKLEDGEIVAIDYLRITQ